MKVLGINFGGRVMEKSEIMVKEALFGAKEAGTEVEFIRTIGMNIKHCLGCGICSRHRDQGENVHCIIKGDDYPELEEKILDADAILVAAPVFSVGTTGQMKNFIDRFGAAHDMAALEEVQRKRIEVGKSGDELLDPRYFKRRPVGYISVGGATTPHWVALGLPLMTEFGTSMNAKVVGQIDAYKQGVRVSPLFDDKLMQDCHELGRRVGWAVMHPGEDSGWFGEEGVCPVCHGKIFMLDNAPEIVCATCGVKGTMEIKDGKPCYTFTEEDKKLSRMTMEGLYDHYWEIQGFVAKIPGVLEEKAKLLEERIQKYREFEKNFH